MLSKLLKNILDSQHNSLHPPNQVIYLWFFFFSPHQEGEGGGEGSRQWGLRSSDVQVSSLQRCHTVPEQQRKLFTTCPCSKDEETSSSSGIFSLS